MPTTRKSSRKRARSTSTPTLEYEENSGRVVSRSTSSKKRRAIASPTPGQPTPRRVSVRIEVSPESANGAQISSPIPTHDDPPPIHTCFVCRRRGGNYAFTCIFEDGSDKCTRCAKEGKPCRAATTAEKAALDARCPQCKSRGHARCHYQDGRPWQKGNGRVSCQVCIRRNKKCGVPVRRTENSNTRAFLQITFVGPQQQEQNAVLSQNTKESESQETFARDTLIDADQQTKLSRNPEDSAEEAPDNVDSYIIPDDSDAAARQLLLEAGGAVLPSPPSTESETESTAPSPDIEIDEPTYAAHAIPSDKDIPAEQRKHQPSLPDRGTSRVRRRTANYSAIYTPLPLDLSDNDSAEEFSSYEGGDEEEEEVESNEEEEASASSADELLPGDENDGENMLSDMDIEPEPLTKPRSKPAASSRSTRKGIDFSLPPMHDNETIFGDLTYRAVELGLADALKKLDRSINVATMCSGTESPLFGLIASAAALNMNAQPSLKFRHLFSAEIEPFKQAFIERNWAPELLFRDIREFIAEEATTATTAYGAVETIPDGVDILVAGFSCKNLSRQNNYQKSLKENGESGETWMAVYEYSRRFRPSIVLLENVKSKALTWHDVVSQWSDIGYEAGWLYCDTKRYYYPQTRERMYMIAIDRRDTAKKASQAVEDWKQTMRKLERPCSSSYETFLANFPRGLVDYSALVSEWAWELCKLRYDHMRSELRLGIKRPCTRWSENGTKQPFDFADHEWFDSRSSREWEAIEVAYLRAAVLDGTDASYKEMIWDVSQNADRFHDNPGLVPCITPNGQVFSTNRQQPLSGMELLGLQGLPLDKIHLARECAAELQDLAGNAMSTTVIAASQLSAIICASQLLIGSSSAQHQRVEELAPSINTLVRVGKLTTYAPNIVEPHAIDVRTLAQHARQSSRLCSRECDERICDAVIQSCTACGHTACAWHAGNPKHVYIDTVERTTRLQRPNAFINEWRPKLPSRISFKNFSGFSFSDSFQTQLSRDELTEAFQQRMHDVDIESRQFYIGGFTRHVGFWKVLYKSDRAYMELCIGEELQWLLYVQPPAELPGDSALRGLLRNPIARGSVKDSLLLAEWEIYVPSVYSIPLRIHGSSETSRSFRNTLGLLDFQRETIPATLHIRIDDKGLVKLPEDWDDITGKYEHLPHCGTASKSLYKRSSDPALYFFLDPDPLSRGNDSFHFSYDCGRLSSEDQRQSLAHLSSSWRPWNPDDTNDKSVNATSSGSWERAADDTMILASNVLSLSAKVLTTTRSLSEEKNVCTNATSVLEVEVPEVLPTSNLDDYFWALDSVSSAPSFPDWQPFGLGSDAECACAPPYPSLLWSIDKAGVATAYEDPKAAASRERAMKTRCPIFHIESETFNKATRIRFGVNISSLAHRAVRNLLRTRQSTPTEPIIASWRILTDQRGTAFVQFPEFRLKSNANDKPFSARLRIAYELRGAQPRALEWMRAQERGITFTLTEIEEAVHAKLGWRAEARAQAKTLVRGGVLADRPSFGKTVITIALIESEFEECREDTSIMNMNNSVTTQKLHLIDTAATLIVCPPHLVDQWQEEFEKFLGIDLYELYSIVSIKTFAELQSLEFEDMQNSRVIIVSWAVLADREYIAYLAGFSAMPEPATASVKGAPNYRAFDAWMERVNQELPAQLAKHQHMNAVDFSASTDNLLRERLNQDEFNMSLPLQLQHGSQYQPYNATQAGKKKSEARVNFKKGKTRVFSVPLLHLFRFNRIVVDEYHYLNVHQKDQKKAHDNVFSSIGIKAIAAHKRWVLSGTPALGSFADVDNISSFLGIHLGKYTARANTGKQTQVEEIQSEAQTKVERFLAHKETMSPYWHQARYQLAQEFLDKFVRQNEPSLEHIHCSESIRIIELDVAHHAVYLELSQHLISQRMALKRTRNAEGADRTNRLNASLNGSSTGEDALLKCALLYGSDHGESGLQTLLQTRSKEYQETVSDLKRLLRGFEGHRKKGFKGLQKSEKEEASISQLYTYFRKDVCIDNWLGDDKATKKIRALLKDAEADGNRNELIIEGNKVDEKIKNAKKALSKLRTTANQLTFRTRSERFVSNVQSLLQPLCEKSNLTRQCDAPKCQGGATISDLFLTSNCGHLSCRPCLLTRTDNEVCVVPSCSTTVQAMNLVKATHLGSRKEKEKESGRSFGRKLDAVAKLIAEVPDDDQCLVFAPDSRTIGDLKDLCDHHNISYPACCERNPAKAIQEFKKSPDVKVLILDLTSETAAGVNLFNANHILFVAPVLVKSQYEYDAAMEQAIARSRRYGQEKKVHVYHFAALRTVDVDILEHRHKRNDGITDVTAPMILPRGKLETREKTKLVRNKTGGMALVPVSWLKDGKVRKTMGVEEEPESFTSLIQFSETIED
ncbi:hypothetical protein P171DRAFT_409502 [Karstenula rhodostoma CBS 690.94]|uniref:Helicase ATP-binding domain-containing protein n=1 Tax=Karstenula rhodostoma CBS 690.94 TaxID=1392251 RepID=A0A9P4PMU7_9PLEO|nr:hypothetical protein P171DRAFT_409502 [Karstenula rhodostoma CBS 690.94]